MVDINKLLQAEHRMIISLWGLEKKYIQRMPLSTNDWQELVDESNAIAEQRHGDSQDALVRVVSAILDEIEFLDKSIKKENEKEEQVNERHYEQQTLSE